MVTVGWGTRILPAGDVVHVIMSNGEETAVMCTFDFSDPAAPRERAVIHLARFPHDLALRDAYGYALYDGYLDVLDLTTTPTATSLLTLSVPANITSHIQVVGDSAYIDTNDGLWILDVSDPAAPREVGHYQLDIPVASADIVGTRAYLTYQLCGWEPDENGEPAGGCGQGVEVVDLEDVSRPRLLGSYGLTIGQNQAWIEHAQLAGHTLYLLTDQVLYAAELGSSP
jgi:hypothetical protein